MLKYWFLHVRCWGGTGLIVEILTCQVAWGLVLKTFLSLILRHDVECWSILKHTVSSFSKSSDTCLHRYDQSHCNSKNTSMRTLKCLFYLPWCGHGLRNRAVSLWVSSLSFTWLGLVSRPLRQRLKCPSIDTESLQSPVLLCCWPWPLTSMWRRVSEQNISPSGINRISQKVNESGVFLSENEAFLRGNSFWIASYGSGSLNGLWAYYWWIPSW